jgi:hypothetical protein
MHGGTEAAFQMVAQPAQVFFVETWMEAADAAVFVDVFNQAHAALAGVGIVEKNAYVDPLVADKIGDIPQDAVDEDALDRRDSVMGLVFRIAMVVFRH